MNKNFLSFLIPPRSPGPASSALLPWCSSLFARCWTEGSWPQRSAPSAWTSCSGVNPDKENKDLKLLWEIGIKYILTFSLVLLLLSSILSTLFSRIPRPTVSLVICSTSCARKCEFWNNNQIYDCVCEPAGSCAPCRPRMRWPLAPID